MWAMSVWLVDGPKVFRPTTAQCSALEQVEVRIELGDYEQPYPALLVDLPTGYEPFNSVLCFKSDKILVCVLNSTGNLNDITSTIAVDGRPMEDSLTHYEDDCRAYAGPASRAMRVTINSCLALVNYGCNADYLYPKEVESDKRLAMESSDRGSRARSRMAVAPSLVKFDQEVVLHKTVRPNGAGDTTGREMPTHWRRGHWAMQPYGPGNSLRKRILRPPVLIHSDRLVGELSNTTVVYRT